MYIKIIFGLLLVTALGLTVYSAHESGYQKAKSEDVIAYNNHAFNHDKNFTQNREVVYLPLIESHVQIEERVKKVIVYVKEKTNWNDVRCMPVSGVYGYADSLYPNNTESTNAIIESVSRAYNSANTSEQ